LLFFEVELGHVSDDLKLIIFDLASDFSDLDFFNLLYNRVRALLILSA